MEVKRESFQMRLGKTANVLLEKCSAFAHQLPDCCRGFVFMVLPAPTLHEVQPSLLGTM